MFGGCDVMHYIKGCLALPPVTVKEILPKKLHEHPIIAGAVLLIACTDLKRDRLYLYLFWLFLCLKNLKPEQLNQTEEKPSQFSSFLTV